MEIHLRSVPFVNKVFTKEKNPLMLELGGVRFDKAFRT